uniref:Putative Anthocyanidin 3-O-glucosyltransferase 2 n=1 Tax=Aegilops tauschii TaxID=37682 RepID=M8BYF8_AEGTA
MRKAQLKEIARGLENSAHRFLWVARSPPEDPTKYFMHLPKLDLDTLFPEGFLKRTQTRGIVAGGGAAAHHDQHIRDALRVELRPGGGINQGADVVLAAVHRAEGEQGVRGGRDEVRGGDGRVRRGACQGRGCGERRRLVMESDEGEKLRARLASAKEKAAEALADGGPSRMAFAEFLKDLKLQERSNKDCS